jgi:protein-L-isoaspartate O-methyltransferase
VGPFKAECELVEDKDSQYSRIRIARCPSPRGPVVHLILGDLFQSAILEEHPGELLGDYLRFFRLDAHFHPSPRRVLLLGGGGYTFARDFLARLPDARLDVVEIDPAVTDLARRHFGLQDDPRLTIIHGDARTFLNESRAEKYDVILVDVFGSGGMPAHLTTREVVESLHAALSEEGVLILNTKGVLAGDAGRFIRAEHATLASVFPQVHLFPLTDLSRADAFKNRLTPTIMMVAFKGRAAPRLTSEDPEVNAFPTRRWTGEVARDVPMLTDDYAPVEYYNIYRSLPD